MNDPTALREEAGRCRETALDYSRRAEGPFLLQVARAFEDLASRLDEAGARPPTPPFVPMSRGPDRF